MPEGVQRGMEPKRTMLARTGNLGTCLFSMKDSQEGRNFAANVGIEFKTPEEYFLHEEPLPFTRSFEPAAFLSTASTTSTDTSKTLLTCIPLQLRLPLTYDSSDRRRKEKSLGHHPAVRKSRFW